MDEHPEGGGDAAPGRRRPAGSRSGSSGIFKSLPFAIWFFLAIEEVPLAAEESMDPRRDVPRGSVLAMHTLLIAAILTLFLNTALPGGASLYGASGFPLLDGFKAIFGATGRSRTCSGCLFLIGLIASFFTIIFAYGRNTYSLSRAGYFPKFLSMTHGERKTPHVALIAGAVVGLRGRAARVRCCRRTSCGAQIVAALLNMAVFAAVISYILQMTSFVLLRRKLPNIERPYRSKWGVPGAVIAGVLAAISLVAIFLNEAYRPGVYGVAIYYVLGVLYFAIAGRHRLVLSPEEEFALTQGEQGVPEQGGTTTSSEEQEAILRRRRRNVGSRRRRHRRRRRRASGDAEGSVTRGAVGETARRPSCISGGGERDAARACSTRSSWRSSPTPARSTPSCACSRTSRAGSWASASSRTSSSRRCSARRASTPACTCWRSTWRWSRCPATSTRAGRPATATSG